MICAKYDSQINPDLSCKFGYFCTTFFLASLVTSWATISQKIKLGKIWNRIFHSFQHIAHLLCKDSHFWEGGGMHILTWDRVYLAFTNPMLALLGKNITWLCDCVVVWLGNITIFIYATLNSPAQVDTKIMSLVLMNPILASNLG